MKIIVLGNKNSLSLKGYNTSFLIINNYDYQLIDCPPGILQSLSENNIDIKNVNEVWITHLHTSHIGGLLHLANYRYNVFNEKTRVIVPVYFIADLKTFFSVMNSDWENMIDLMELSFTNSKYFRIKKRNGLIFEFYRVFHIKKKFCYSIKINNPEGKKVFISGNTKFDKKLIDFAKDSNIIFHEVTFDNSQKNVHTYIDELNTLDLKIKKKIYMTNLPDKLPKWKWIIKRKTGLNFTKEKQEFII
jgi:ribonuclease BN (tRNA processing enzyme)